MGLFRRLTHNGHIRDEVDLFFKESVPAGRILDLPAGDGVNALQLEKAGYEVECADLFPEVAMNRGLLCHKIDMTQRLPYEDETFEGVLHSEGIEHVDNQVGVLRELARVLKPNGLLVVTTPNILFLAARLSSLWTGHPRPRRWRVTETDGYWGETQADTSDTYYGHVFLINAFQLRFYLSHVGLEITGVKTTRYSKNSLLLAPILYPFVRWSTRRMLRKGRSKLTTTLSKQIEREILGPDLLFGTKLIMIARKPSASARMGGA